MADIRYICKEWQEQLDALKELISGWISIRDSLQAADDDLEDIDRDFDDKDEDRAISSCRSSLRDEIDTLCDSYNKLKKYCERIGDVIRDTVDTPFYNKMDDFTQSMESLSINNYTTENTLGVTSTTNYEGVDVSIRKQSISIQDIFTSNPAMDKIIKEDYNAFMELPDAPALSYGDYKQALSYTRSFDYKSIEDSQLSKEFWTGLVIGGVIVVASFVCPPAGIALGIAYGTLELGSAASGRDWLTQRELGKGECVMRGTFALLDIIPGVRAFGASMHTARVATGTLGQADNVLQVMGKYTLQRTKNIAGQMGRASRRTVAFGNLLVSNTDEAGQLFLAKSKVAGSRVLSAGKSSIDDLGRKYKDLTAKGKNVLSGNFDDIKRYVKNLVPGEYVLVATPDGSVFRVAKSELGESSLELVARDTGLHAMNGIKGGTEGSSGAKNQRIMEGNGAYNGKVTNGDGFGKLTDKSYNVSEKGINRVKEHIANNYFDCYENTAMIERLEKALKNKEKISGADASFYMHELKESTIMKNGIPYDPAHKEALEFFNVSPYSVYHKDVINMQPEWWGKPWFDFWEGR